MSTKNKSKKKVTLSSIAKEAGVSIATVSRVINNNSSVNDDIKVNIQNLLERNKYIKKNKFSKRIIFLSIPNISNPFFSDLMNSIVKTASLYNYYLITFDFNENNNLSEDYVRYLAEIGVAGCIIIPDYKYPKDVLKIISQLDCPVIFLDRKVDIENINYVGLDNKKGSYNGTKYLLDLGHKNIIYLAGKESTSTEKERYEGFCLALEESKIKFNYKDYYVAGNHDFDISYTEIIKKVKSKLEFTAIFGSSDIMCFGARRALEESSIKVPDDVSIIGYDDIVFSSMIALTTVSSPVKELGKSAVISLLDLINGRVKENINIVLPCNLIIRKSCKRI